MGGIKGAIFLPNEMLDHGTSPTLAKEAGFGRPLVYDFQFFFLGFDQLRWSSRRLPGLEALKAQQ